METYWNSVEDYLHDAKGIAWDTCHKIYILMDEEQMRLMAEYEYDPLFRVDELGKEASLRYLKQWFDNSCGLRFIQAVETTENPNDGFTSVIPQGATDEEEDE